jgi:endonuclease YncB( thermonuclease family)
LSIRIEVEMKKALRLLACATLLALAGCGQQSRQESAAAPTENGPAPVSEKFDCTPASVHDGDTFACADGTKVRVAGINAREIEWDGSRMEDAGCNDGAPCPSVDAVAARDKLVALLGHAVRSGSFGRVYVSGPALACASNGTSYDRIAAWCVSPASGDISCDMVKSGAAARWDHFWRDHRCG